MEMKKEISESSTLCHKYLRFIPESLAFVLCCCVRQGAMVSFFHYVVRAFV